MVNIFGYKVVVEVVNNFGRFFIGKEKRGNNKCLYRLLRLFGGSRLNVGYLYKIKILFIIFEEIVKMLLLICV